MDEKEFIKMAPHLRLVALQASRSSGADETEAEDIAQEAMIRLWQMLERLGTISSIDGFTATIARHLTISGYRKSRREATKMAFFKPAAQGASPEDSMVMRDDERWLSERLEKLPSTEYAILQMRQVEHLDSTEIARRLGITEASVRSLLSRARRRLLEEIRKMR